MLSANSQMTTYTYLHEKHEVQYRIYMHLTEDSALREPRVEDLILTW
jgi:hypothetical protein